MILSMPNGQKVRIPDDWSEDQQRDFLFKVHPELKEQYQNSKQDSQKTLPESKPTRPYLGDVALNAIQSTANALRGIYNLPASGINKLFGSNLKQIPYSNYAPERGRIPGELISMLAPTPAKITTAEHLAAPLINALTRMGEHGAAAKVASVAGKGATRLSQGALQGSLYSPEDPTTGALSGTIGQGVGSIFGKTLSSPLIGTGIRTLLGGGIGGIYGAKEGGFPGALEYGTAGAFGGRYLPMGITTLLGKSGEGLKPGRELLSAIPEEKLPETLKKVEAAKRLGIPITPAEATGMETLAEKESSLYKTPKAKDIGKEILEKRKEKRSESVNNLLDTIWKDTPEMNSLLKNSYNNLRNREIPLENVENLKNNELIKDAFEDIKKGKTPTDIVLREHIGHEPENSILYLDAVKRKIDEIGRKERIAGSKTVPSFAKQKSKEITNLIDEYHPDYKQTRQMAKRSILRNNIEDKLSDNGVTSLGSEFYNKFLRDQRKYNKLYNDLSASPQAQKIIEDMKSSWKNIIDPRTVKTAFGKVEYNMDQMRNSFADIISKISQNRKDINNIEALKFIHSGKWDEEIKEIAKQKISREERLKKADKLINKILRSATIVGMN